MTGETHGKQPPSPSTTTHLCLCLYPLHLSLEWSIPWTIQVLFSQPLGFCHIHIRALPNIKRLSALSCNIWSPSLQRGDHSIEQNTRNPVQCNPSKTYQADSQWTGGIIWLAFHCVPQAFLLCLSWCLELTARRISHNFLQRLSIHDSMDIYKCQSRFQIYHI